VQGGGGRTSTEVRRVATRASCPRSDRGERKNKISEKKRKGKINPKGILDFLHGTVISESGRNGMKGKKVKCHDT
jgi:hypothetical protein